MKEYTTYGKMIMKNIREILFDYKKLHKMTNMEMAVKCDLSLSEYDKIMYSKAYSKYGCSADTIYKVCLNLKINANDIFGFREHN